MCCNRQQNVITYRWKTHVLLSCGCNRRYSLSVIHEVMGCLEQRLLYFHKVLLLHENINAKLTKFW